MQDYPFIREVRSPLTKEQLRPLDERCEVVQFSTPLLSEEYSRLASFLDDYPKMTLRIYGHYGIETDLEFLREFPSITNFQADLYQLKSFDGLRHLNKDLTYLGLGQTKSRRYSLSILRRFPALRELYLEGHTKDFSAVGDLQELEELTLRSITLPGLDILTRLRKLRSLDIKLGGTTNLELLPSVGRLRYLELWMIRGLSDLTAISQLRDLQYLFLQALKNVTTLPTFATLSNLRRVHLEAMKGLNDLQQVADAPQLEELLAIDMRQLSPDAFRVFVGHSRLRRASIGLGSERKNRAVQEMLRLPPTTYDTEFEFQ